ncbi:hypothetical protein [Streptosporangium sp. KLBMP 9127]|nr:hypothetical protein [Streptosporangium sp. KLBMP 9127]
MSMQQDFSSPSAPILEVNQLVTVARQPGTHTIRAAEGGGEDTRPAFYLVDVYGELRRIPAADVRPHPGSSGVTSPHKVCTAEGSGVSTAAALNFNRDAAREAMFGTDKAKHPVISNMTLARDPKFEEFALVEPVAKLNGFTDGGKGKPLSEAGLEIEITLRSNIGLTAKPYDLVPVVLERPQGELDTIIVLTPASGDVEGNIITFTVHYTLEQLAKLIRITLPEDTKEQIEKIERELPELGVKARWLTFNGGNNAANHTSGGVLGKGNIGKIRLVDVGLDQLKATERFRITEWNVSEDLRPGRPVYDSFSAILQAGKGKEMATTLEAESEYVLETEEDHAHVTARLDAVMNDRESWKDLGILDFTGADKLTKYTDIYYDVYTGKVCKWTLLSREIVLRHRSVTTDEDDVFLLTVKGRRREKITSGPRKPGAKPEFIRLASQVQLQPEPAPLELRRFLTDTTADNAFGRVLMDALIPPQRGHDTTAPSSPLPQGNNWWFGPALTVVSLRKKYKVTLANSVTVEISVDSASATPIQEGIGHLPDVHVYSVEFGVGHPALITAATTTTTATDGVTPTTTEAANSAARRIARPYHVPQDLAPSLFDKVDYVQYRTLTEQLMGRLFPTAAGTTMDQLGLGGNKAALLAKKLGLLK